MSILAPDFRPMLGHTDVPTDDWLRMYFDQGQSFIAFPKYDGIRVLMDIVPVTRKLKILPNIHVRETLVDLCPTYCDGELTLPKGEFHDVQSAFMSRHGFPEFVYHIFDFVQLPFMPFYERNAWLSSLQIDPDPRIEILTGQMISSFATLQNYEEEQVSLGHEGVILRNPYASYKYGRSTLNEAGMLKLKRFCDDEATVIGFEELMHNDNDPKINALGLQERGHGIQKKRRGNTLGAFICTSAKFKEPFNVSCGHLNARARQEIWDDREYFLDKEITYIYQPHGTKDRPRSARFKWFRRD
jgi:DNA ligase-1